MTDKTDNSSNMAARNWVQVLKKYREPNSLRSSFELGGQCCPVHHFVGFGLLDRKLQLHRRFRYFRYQRLFLAAVVLYSA